MIVNAGQAQIDFSWMQKLATDENFDVKLIVRSELAIIALQGPKAFERLCQVRPAWNEALRDLARFSSTYVDEVVMVARTGYTGEDGYEIVLPDSLAPALWNDLAQAGVRPCGLAARDTLRLEAGLNLYGQDMDETTRPAQAALGWTVDLRDQTRRFIGREALEQGGAAAQQLVGLRLLGRGIMRNGAKVKTPYGAGVVTSGTMSPTLGASIALARVPQDVRADDTLQVEVRGKWMDARVVKMPFVRSGTAAALNKLKV